MAGSRVTYEEIECKTALNRVQGMSFKWSLNPYRGCVHGCHYCFARRFHTYFDLNAGRDFTKIILVKTNVADVLRRELSGRSWKRETVSVGTATDPYQPIEGKYRITRSCLEAFADWRSPVGLITKGTMVVRDADVMSDLAARAGCTVIFSVTTLDRDLWRKLEPGTPPPDKRLSAMSRLIEVGVNAGVLIAPVIPGITDTNENLDTVVRAAADHGARFVGSNVMYLKYGTKEHFMDFVQAEYPALLSRYRRLYHGDFVPMTLKNGVQDLISDLKRKYGLADRPSGSQTDEPKQLALSL